MRENDLVCMNINDFYNHNSRSDMVTHGIYVVHVSFTRS
jgi:hypothetical protein